MSGRRGAAIAPPSTLDDEHLPRLDAGKAAVATKSKPLKPEDESPLAAQKQRLQELRGRLVGTPLRHRYVFILMHNILQQKCREVNKKEFIEEERIKAGEKRSDDLEVGKKRKRTEVRPSHFHTPHHHPLNLPHHDRWDRQKDNGTNEMRSITAEDAQWKAKRAKKKANAAGVRPSREFYRIFQFQ